MNSDPEQEKDVSKNYPEVIKTLSAAYEAAGRDVSKAGFDPLDNPGETIEVDGIFEGLMSEFIYHDIIRQFYS